MRYNLKVRRLKGSTHITYYTCPINRTASEESDKITDDIKKIKILEDLHKDLNKEKSLSISVNRSKDNIYNIAMSNEWELFITFTFDRNGDVFGVATDSSDYNTVSKAISDWCNLRKKTDCPDLKYLIVPELHSDKVHYHFHGLFANCSGLKLTESGCVDSDGCMIYNVDSWKFGFTTASKIKYQDRATKYLCKYISKDLMNNLKYKKRYYASHNLNVAAEEFYNIPRDELYDFCDVDDALYIKTVNGSGFNECLYMEKKTDVDIPDKYKV